MLFAATAAGCDAFVEGVNEPVQSIPDDHLTNERQVDLLIAGVKTQFADTYDRLSVRAGALSDEFIFDRLNPNSKDPFDEQLDIGLIPYDNLRSVEIHNKLGRFRYVADNLVGRVGEIEFTNPDLRRRALFAGNFYGAIARYFLAAFSAVRPHEGGGIITVDPHEPGQFIPSDEMYTLALEKLDDALRHADDQEQRMVSTLAARIHLLREDFQAARAAAVAGLHDGDDPLRAEFSTTSSNRYFNESGPARKLWVFDNEYKAYVDADPNEANRIPMDSVLSADSTRYFYYQDRYNRLDSPIPFLTWRENELILAELDLRDGNAGSALARVNTVRAFWGIGPLDLIDMSVLEEERRKELWGTGLRLTDQRRFEHWHLGLDTWQYFPIPQTERDLNPNIN